MPAEYPNLNVSLHLPSNNLSPLGTEVSLGVFEERTGSLPDQRQYFPVDAQFHTPTDSSMGASDDDKKPGTQDSKVDQLQKKLEEYIAQHPQLSQPQQAMEQTSSGTEEATPTKPLETPGDQEQGVKPEATKPDVYVPQPPIEIKNVYVLRKPQEDIPIDVVNKRMTASLEGKRDLSKFGRATRELPPLEDVQPSESGQTVFESSQLPQPEQTSSITEEATTTKPLAMPGGQEQELPIQPVEAQQIDLSEKPSAGNTQESDQTQEPSVVRDENQSGSGELSYLAQLAQEVGISIPQAFEHPAPVVTGMLNEERDPGRTLEETLEELRNLKERKGIAERKVHFIEDFGIVGNAIGDFPGIFERAHILPVPQFPINEKREYIIPFGHPVRVYKNVLNVLSLATALLQQAKHEGIANVNLKFQKYIIDIMFSDRNRDNTGKFLEAHGDFKKIMDEARPIIEEKCKQYEDMGGTFD